MFKDGIDHAALSCSGGSQESNKDSAFFLVLTDCFCKRSVTWFRSFARQTYRFCQATSLNWESGHLVVEGFVQYPADKAGHQSRLSPSLQLASTTPERHNLAKWQGHGTVYELIGHLSCLKAVKAQLEPSFLENRKLISGLGLTGC